MCAALASCHGCHHSHHSHHSHRSLPLSLCQVTRVVVLLFRAVPPTRRAASHPAHSQAAPPICNERPLVPYSLPSMQSTPALFDVRAVGSGPSSSGCERGKKKAHGRQPLTSSRHLPTVDLHGERCMSPFAPRLAGPRQCPPWSTQSGAKLRTCKHTSSASAKHASSCNCSFVPSCENSCTTLRSCRGATPQKSHTFSSGSQTSVHEAQKGAHVLARGVWVSVL